MVQPVPAQGADPLPFAPDKITILRDLDPDSPTYQKLRQRLVWRRRRPP